MNKLIASVFILTLISILLSCQQPQKNHDLETESNKDWLYLFDGKTTDGWRGFQQETAPAGWVIENGNLIGLGEGGDLGGDLITLAQFEDFELYLGWSISGEGNSGIFFHVLEDEYPTVYATGPEYQLIDDVGFPEELKEWQQTGANYAMHNATNKVLKRVGEFNTSRLIVKNAKVEHWLNGKKCLNMSCGQTNGTPGFKVLNGRIIRLTEWHEKGISAYKIMEVRLSSGKLKSRI